MQIEKFLSKQLNTFLDGLFVACIAMIAFIVGTIFMKLVIRVPIFFIGVGAIWILGRIFQAVDKRWAA